MNHTVARVVFDSPLPQLNRIFDYELPADLAPQVQIGSIVAVQFNRSAKPIHGYVVGLIDHSDFKGELSQILEVVSPRQVLTPKIFELVQAVANRQAVSVGDVLRTALPTRAVRVDQKWQPPEGAIANDPSNESPILQTWLCKPAVVREGERTAPSWFFDVEAELRIQSERGESSIVCVPDFRDIERLSHFLAERIPSLVQNRYLVEATPSERYARHLLAASDVTQVVIGSRSALWAPVSRLGLILLWDDEDQSHFDQQSPYISSRELALVRQSIYKCNLTLLSHSRSVATKRLIEIGYLRERPAATRSNVAFSDTDARLDSLAYNTIKEGLKTGPVLVQVASLGQAAGLYCGDCSKRATCDHCGSGVWLDSKGQVRCRVCEGFNLKFQCRNCGGSNRRMGRAGATRTAEELGKSFSGVRVLESTSQSPIQSISAKPQIVVSTPGVEPMAEGGFAAVVILDAKVALAKDTLSAEEDAIRQWANAIALSSSAARCALVSVPEHLGQRFALWNLDEIAAGELAERLSLGFPPARRIVSATGLKQSVADLADKVRGLDTVRVLGISSSPTSTDETQLVFTFAYSATSLVAPVLSSFALTQTSKTRVSSSGRNRRAVTIKMDDSRVL